MLFRSTKLSENIPQQIDDNRFIIAGFHFYITPTHIEVYSTDTYIIVPETKIPINDELHNNITNYLSKYALLKITITKILTEMGHNTYFNGKILRCDTTILILHEKNEILLTYDKTFHLSNPNVFTEISNYINNY